MKSEEGKQMKNLYYKLTNYQKKYMKVKDVLDGAIVIVGLIILSPIFLAVIVLCKLEDGWKAPVFFSQKRVGIH